MSARVDTAGSTAAKAVAALLAGVLLGAVAFGAGARCLADLTEPAAPVRVDPAIRRWDAGARDR